MDLPSRPSRLGERLLWLTLAIALTVALLAVRGVLSGPQAAMGVLPLAAVIAMGVSRQQSGVFAQPLLRVHTARPELALTFDDGPDPRWTPALLDLLDARGHRATFFVIGARAAQHTDLLAEIAKRGHELANHTWSHSYLTVFQSPDTLARDLDRTNRVIEAAAGRAPRWFRPPVGLLSPRVPLGVRRAGLELVAWTATARDGVARTSTAEAMARLEPAIVAGAILVMHDAPVAGDRPLIVLELTRRLLGRMETENLVSVTLSELCEPGRR